MPGSPSNGLDQALWLGVLTICAVVMVVALWRKRRDGQTTAGELLREQRARIRDQRELCKTTEDLLTRLDHAVQSAATKAEAQSTQLSALIRAADERVERLNAAIRAIETTRAPRVRPDPAPLSSTPQILSAPRGLAPEIPDTPRRIAVRRFSQPALEPSLPNTGPPHNAAADVRTPAALPTSDAPAVSVTRHARVYDLADAGRTPSQIAAALRLPLGEVELVLNLRSFA